nr:heavy metal translocating P-type ATPase [Leucobacter sp.]
MNTLLRWAKAYPAVALTIVVAAVGLTLLATPARGAAPWIVGGYALCIAAWQAYGMVRQLMRGHAGLDILAVIAIVAAVSVGEVWAALIVVLMITGGEALEDYAENRSKRELTALLKRAPQQATRLLRAPVGAGEGSASPSGVLGDERSETVPVGEILKGDRLLVRP